MSPVDVTVVIATRNRPATLERALDSVARQSLESFESIVVDDGSEPQHAAAYRDIVGRFGVRFKLVQPLQPSQLGSGPSSTRNRGMDAGHGRYIAFLDDDDTWTWDDHLKTAVEVLDETGANLYSADMQAYRGDELVWETLYPNRADLANSEIVRTKPVVKRCSRAAFVKVASHRVVHLNTVVVRRTHTASTGGFLYTLRYAEDLEFVLRLADATDWVLVSEQLVARHRLPEGDSHSLTLHVIQRHLQTLAAAQHLRLNAKSREVRHAARRMEAWTVRLLSQTLRQEGRRGTASALALQALVTYPTLGALVELGRAAIALREPAGRS